MSRLKWMKSEYGLGVLAGNYETQTNVPVISNDLRRDMEDRKYKLPCGHRDDVIELLDEVED